MDQDPDKLHPDPQPILESLKKKLVLNRKPRQSDDFGTTELDSYNVKVAYGRSEHVAHV